jgi:hypothetical protein
VLLLVNIITITQKQTQHCRQRAFFGRVLMPQLVPLRPQNHSPPHAARCAPAAYGENAAEARQGQHKSRSWTNIPPPPKLRTQVYLFSSATLFGDVQCVRQDCVEDTNRAEMLLVLGFPVTSLHFLRQASHKEDTRGGRVGSS